MDVFDDILNRRFTGHGPFPPSEHRLGVVDGELRKSMKIFPPKLSGDTITLAAGGTVKYFDVHEYGFSGTVSVRAHERKIKRKRRRRKGEAATTMVKAHQRENVVIPARAPLRTGFEDKQTSDRFTKAIVKDAEKAIMEELKKLQ
jgi:hypothetical protein